MVWYILYRVNPIAWAFTAAWLDGLTACWGEYVCTSAFCEYTDCSRKLAALDFCSAHCRAGTKSAGSCGRSVFSREFRHPTLWHVRRYAFRGAWY